MQTVQYHAGDSNMELPDEQFSATSTDCNTATSSLAAVFCPAAHLVLNPGSSPDGAPALAII
jgi:hypothetical protein